jgi:hypothetical protein
MASCSAGDTAHPVSAPASPRLIRSAQANDLMCISPTVDAPVGCCGSQKSRRRNSETLLEAAASCWTISTRQSCTPRSTYPEVQRSYRELAEYYAFLIAPCRPRTPEHKGTVEQGRTGPRPLRQAQRPRRSRRCGIVAQQGRRHYDRGDRARESMLRAPVFTVNVLEVPQRTGGSSPIAAFAPCLFALCGARTTAAMASRTRMTP